MNKNWCVIGKITTPETDTMIDLIEKRTGGKPAHYHAYGVMLDFLKVSGLDINHPAAFKDGVLAGNSMEELEFTLQWLEGMPNAE